MAERPPLRDATAGLVVAVAYVVLAVVWMAVGEPLPGGRWFSVHLFTLGVITNAIGEIAPRIAASVGPVGVGPVVAHRVVRNAGVATVLIGRVAGPGWVVGVGATLLGADLLAVYVRCRRSRKGATQPRYAPVLRLVERAIGAFVHGAVLGGLLAVGVLGGGAVRAAHLHVMVLGWGVVPVLAAAPFFVGMMARTRMDEDAEAGALRAAGRAATAVTVATLALLGTWVVEWPRYVAVLALLVVAVAAGRVASYVITVTLGARHGAAATMLVVAVSLAPVAVLVDAAAVATRDAVMLTVAGVVALVGVSGQAIVAVGGHLLAVSAATARSRARAIEAAERSRVVWAAAFGVGLGALTVAVLARARGAWPVLAWVTVLASAVGSLTTIAVAARRSDATRATE